MTQNGYYRKVIKIRAVDSPNVQLGLQQAALGITPTDDIIIPGVLTYSEYLKRRRIWDKVRQCVGLDAEFFVGAENLLFPPDWLNHSSTLIVSGRRRGRTARAIGIDPAEGGDKTTMAAVDEWGVLKIVSKSTPDTSRITGEAIAFGEEWEVHPSYWVFDRGGGGKQHADRLRTQGYEVRTVSFGASVSLDPRLGLTPIDDRLMTKEGKSIYKNMRAMIFGTMSEWLDPGVIIANEYPYGWENIFEGEGAPPAYKGWQIPFDGGDPNFEELRRQLALIPRYFDEEGRLFLPPKNRKPGERGIAKKMKSLVELIGHSPDEADAVALALYGMVTPPDLMEVGAMW